MRHSQESHDRSVDLVRPRALGRWIAQQLGDRRWEDLSATLISGGRSNLTFSLQSPAGELILRRPPSGRLLPSAHDMNREVIVQRALAPSSVPVASVVLEDRDAEVLGLPFYVMAKVDGHVIRGSLPAGYAESPGERRSLGNALIDTLACLHALVPEEVGLAGFGRPEGFLERQMRRWCDQWEATKTRNVAALDALVKRLGERRPSSGRVAIVHGDFRLDNCVMDRHDPARVAAVLDWELATRGDPLVDLGTFLFFWREPGEAQISLTPTVTALAGFPRRSELVDRYVAATGIDPVDLRHYWAFAHFKFAIIAQGVGVRVRAGAMAGQTFGDMDDEISAIAQAGLVALDAKSW